MPNGTYRYPDAENEVHFCGCGCGQRISFRPVYRSQGYPRVIQGHWTKEMLQEIAEKLKGKPAWNKGLIAASNPSLAAQASKLMGRTAESHPYLAAAAEKMRGRTKYNYAGIAAAAEKNRGRAGWCKGLTKVSNSSLASASEKLKGRTKYNDLGYAKISIALRGRIGLTGDKSPAWRGGKSFEPYTTAFNRALKDSIRQRDNYTCQLCGVPECECRRKLDCHHLDYVKTHSQPGNLISLCCSCNSQVNTNRDYWTSYFTKKLRQKKFAIVISWLPKAIKRHQEVTSCC